MKIIISHDVDHLFVSDHIMKDLTIEKQMVRSLIYFVQKKISLKVLISRLGIFLDNRMNRIEEVMEFDKQHSIPSVFFFGMVNGLGMSYTQRKAVPYIKRVRENGFDVGVHGIEFQAKEAIQKEHDDFMLLTGMQNFGIRNHYVRYDEQTFIKMSSAGYIYDSTEFNKESIIFKNPYKVDMMWEFPLLLMDVYICQPGKAKESIEKTHTAILKAERMGIRYFTILFHDYLFNGKLYPQEKEWYIDTVKFCEYNGFGFISYKDAIAELDTMTLS